MPVPRRRVVGGVVAGAVALLVAIGVLSGAFGAAGRWGLYATGLWVDGGASTIPASALSAPPTTATPTPSAAAPSPLLRAPSTGDPLDAAALKRVLAGVDRTDIGTVGAQVIDVASGTVLYGDRASTPLTPASTMKLLTTVAALATLGPDHRFTTGVVATEPGHLVLVGGGDPYLATKADAAHPDRATLADLAARTATALRAQGLAEVSLDWDASLFAGPGWNPTWPEKYGDEVATTSALWADGARTQKVNPGPRDADPARAAASAFAAALRKQGIAVTGKGAAVTVPRTGVDTVAQVESESLETIVETVLRNSDNDAAEVLFRQVSVATGGNGSIKASAAALQAELTKLGVWVDRTRIVDGSGMSRDNAVPAELTVRIMALGLSDDRPELRSLVTGLPVAAADGSLRSRYFSSGTEAGRGVVRAKTGTLTKVHALAGYTRTASGRTVAFAFVVNGGDDFSDRVFLDRITSALTSCGC